MEVELKKEDIICLVKGCEPDYNMMGELERMELGYYTGGFEDRWEWNYSTSKCWDKYSEKELYDLYLRLK